MKNFPTEKSNPKKRLGRFFKKLKNLNSHVSSLEGRIMELESAHDKLTEKIAEADLKVARLSKKMKAIRVKIKSKDRWINQLDTMPSELPVQWMKEPEIKWEMKVGDDTKEDEEISFGIGSKNGLRKRLNRIKKKSSSKSGQRLSQGPRPSEQDTKKIIKITDQDSEKVQVDDKTGVGKAFRDCFQEAQEKDANRGNGIAVSMESNGSGEDFDFECPICAEEFKSVFEVGRHLEYSHDPSHQSELPIKAPAKKPKFRCGLCASSLSSLPSLKRHTKSLHDNVMEKKISRAEGPPRTSLDYECKFCKETFPTWEKFKSTYHMGKHEVNFERKRNLPSVFRGFTSIFKYNCSECSKHFETKDILTTHFMKIHAWKKQFVCKVESCVRSFTTMQVLHRHEKVHEKHQFMISSDAE